MMSTSKVGLLMAVLGSLAALPACWAPSLYPLYDDKHLTYEPALEGRWQTQPGDACLLVITGEAEKQEYSLKYSAPPENKDGCRDTHAVPVWDSEQAGPFSGRLVQLGSSLFLDVLPENQTAVHLGWIPAHTLFKVSVNQKKLSLIQPSDRWLCEASRAKQTTIGECVSSQDKPVDFLFTAPTAVLQDFVQKHANDDEVFPAADPDFTFTRTAGVSK